MYSQASIHKPRDIDFQSVALYLPAVQVVLALLLCCATTLTLASISGDCRSTAPRAATMSAIIALICVFRPIRVQEVHGMDLIFDTIRPAVVAYWIALICEQLVYTGCASNAATVAADAASITNTTTAHRIIYHILIVVAAIAGFLRAYHPMSQQDVPFLISTSALIFIAIFPPTPLDTSGPLCHVDGIWDAAERLARALLFGLVFCALAYASEPTRHCVGEIALCASRATAASAWILGVHPFMLPLAIVQSGLAILRRMRTEPFYDTASDVSEKYATLEIQGFQGGMMEEGGSPPYEMNDDVDLHSTDEGYEDAHAQPESQYYTTSLPRVAIHANEQAHFLQTQPPSLPTTSTNEGISFNYPKSGIRFENIITEDHSHTASSVSSNESSNIPSHHTPQTFECVSAPNATNATIATPLTSITTNSLTQLKPLMHVNASGPGGSFAQIPSKQRMEEIAASVQ